MQARSSKIFHIFLAASLALFPPLSTYSMQSENYSIWQDSINFGGTEESASASYRLSDTMGEVATGESGAGCYAMSFDGTNGYVATSASSSFEIQQHTLSVWIKAVDFNQYRGILETNTLPQASPIESRLMTFGGNEVRYHPNYSDFGSGTYVSFSNLPTNEWIHLVGTWDGSVAAAYLNGVKVDEVNISGTMVYPVVPRVHIGQNASYTNRRFNGLIDDVRIYNHALSETEIADLYKGNQVDSTGLVGYWNFNEGSGTTAIDVSGNNNTGTIYGATYSTDTPAATCKVLNAGYRTMDETYIAMTDPADVVMSPDLGGMTGGTSYGSTSWNVTTDSRGGYQVSVRAGTSPALMSGAESFADYTPAGSAPDFIWSIADTDSEFGFTVEGEDTISKFLDNGSACNIGTGNIADRCWGPFTTNDQVVAGSSFGNHPLGTETTLKLRAQSGTSHLQSNGLYQATITVTALAL